MTRDNRAGDGSADDHLPVGTAVEVFSGFNQAWVAGFTIAGVTSEGYRLRRVSDDSFLPALFTEDDVRVVW